MGNSAAEVASVINELLTGILGLDSGTNLDTNKPMNKMGLDSLLAMDLIAGLEEKFGVQLTDTVHVDHPTITALAAHISQKS
jgi:acyl carrier protein